MPKHPDRTKLNRLVRGLPKWKLPELVLGGDHVAQLQKIIGGLLVGPGVCRLVGEDGLQKYWEASALVTGDERLTGNHDDHGVLVHVQFGHVEHSGPMPSWFTRACITFDDRNPAVPYVEGAKLSDNSILGTDSTMGTYSQQIGPYQREHDAIMYGRKDSVLEGFTGNILDPDIEYRLQQAIRILGTCAVEDVWALEAASPAALAARNAKHHFHLQPMG